MSLALADALVAAAVMTFAIANDVTGRWAFGARTCRMWMSADVMCSTASILNLFAISLDRYVHVRSPLHYDRLVTHRRSLAAIAVVWIMSALISFLPIHLGWHRVNGITGATVTSTTITVDNSSTPPSHIYWLVHHTRMTHFQQELSYRKQIARQLRTHTSRAFISLITP